MQFSATADPIHEIKGDVIIAGVFASDNGLVGLDLLPTETKKQLQSLADSGDIATDENEITVVRDVAGLNCNRLLLVGMGAQDKFSPSKLQAATKAAVKYAKGRKWQELVVTLNSIAGITKKNATRIVVTALIQGDYKYDATLSDKGGKNQIRQIVLISKEDISNDIAVAEAMGTGGNRARQLGNLPPNICNPEFLADQAREIQSSYDNVSLDVLDRAAMEKAKMGALLAVARGSHNEPRLIVLKYQGAAESEQPHVLVGKGITFDTGGISLKPGKAMDEMKFDMCGAAGVIGAFESVAKLQLPINLMCIVPAVENMPDGNAYRPGDVVTSMSGKTVEVLNTDAEGRLILCDALTYAQQFKPKSIIDVATLTGACVIALGNHASGLMTKHDDLAEELLDAGEYVHDRAWRLPLWDEYQSQLKSPYADFSNLGGAEAGAITAGCFLARFTEGQRWAHIDIAGTAWQGGARNGASGRPVSLLTQYMINQSEQ